MVKFYVVGGYVRDELLGVPSKDIDFAVEAESWEQMLEALKERNVLIWQERPEYFAVRAKDPVFGPADFVLCRKDGFYSDGRRPDNVEVGTILDDLSRRDFTINAIAKDAETGEILDPFNGRKDLQNNLLRTVGVPYDRFNEDPLRLLRAMRFHIVRGFNLSVAIGEALKDVSLLNKLVKTIPIERVYEELNKCFETNTWNSLMFLDGYPRLEYKIFKEMGLNLEPTLRP